MGDKYDADMEPSKVSKFVDGFPNAFGLKAGNFCPLSDKKHVFCSYSPAYSGLQPRQFQTKTWWLSR